MRVTKSTPVVRLMIALYAAFFLLWALSCAEGVHFRGDETAVREDLSSLKKRAEDGDVSAQALLGFRFYKGNGVDQDFVQAYEWFRKAAEQGDTFAQLGLGTMYSAGQGVDQDDVQAATWYRRAAEAGNVGCQYRLGAMYSEGRGVELCYIQAYKWLSLAARRGVTKAATLRDNLAEEKMTPEQVEEARNLVRDWLKTHE